MTTNKHRKVLNQQHACEDDNADDELPAYSTPEEVVARYRISPGTLDNWVSRGRGPRPTRINGKRLFSRRSIREWERQCEQAERKVWS
jgi:predicted DNA-binding transcriptional regulator AlpA